MTRIALIRSGPTAGPEDFLVPPLGLMYLSSYIRPHGYEPHIIDLKIERLDDAELVRRVRQLNPDVIGIGAFTPDLHAFHSTAQLMKRSFPSVPLVVGGPHASTDPDDAVANEAVDCAVLGEGEATFLDVLNTLAAGRSLDQVPGLALRGSKGRAVRTAPREPIRDLDAIPFPAWELVDLNRYARFYSFSPMRPRPYMAVFTSRACPYQCTYCHTIFGKEFRCRSPENVVAELRELKERYNINTIEVCDDIFNLNWRRSTEVCQAIAAANLGTRMAFPNGLRADIMRDDLLQAMVDAGTYFISYAIESGSPRIQKFIKKRLDLERAREVIARTVRAGIYVNGFFMMGFPTETREEVQMTIDYGCSTRLHSATFFLLNPFRGTEIYEQAAKEGMTLLNNDPSYTVYHSGTVNCSTLTNTELLNMKRKAYLRFYFGGGRIVRSAWCHPDKLALGVLGVKALRILDLGSIWRRDNAEVAGGMPPLIPLPPVTAEVARAAVPGDVRAS
jgi:anaerobic magnesium-protoporphyrin IX monomethyl ester cyclase